MTVAESKVKEFANKLLDMIVRSENEDPKITVNTVKYYLCGIVDGLDFSKAMNHIGTADNRSTTDEAESSDGKL